MANVSEIKQAIQGFQQSGRRVKMKADFEDSIKQDYAHIEGLESLLAAKLAYFENEDWSQFSKWYMEMSHAELQVGYLGLLLPMSLEDNAVKIMG